MCFWGEKHLKSFSQITIGQYYPVTSVIHRLDARVKIGLTGLAIIAMFIIRDWFGFLLVTLFFGLIIIMGKLPLRWVFRALKPILYILIFTLLVHIFFTEGRVLAQVWVFRATSEGLRNGLFISVRLILLVLGTSLLTFTTTPMELNDGIEYYLKPLTPLRVPAHELAMMMTIALRFIPTLLMESDKLIKAQVSRGADFESKNIFKRAKNFLPLLVPLFVGAFRRADDLALAMDARCYRGGKGRTRMRELKMETKDYIALVLSIVFLLLVSILGYFKIV